MLKWLLITLVAIGVIGWVAVIIASEEMPKINPSDEAEALANQMLTTLNKPGWDTVRYLQWTFPGGHHYFWDKENNQVEIKWVKNRVLLNLDQMDGLAYTNSIEKTKKKKQDLIDKAWAYWCNDSFWMFAPFKIKDPGTERTLVTDVDKGKKGLLVSYKSGGVTPGDAYLWLLDDKNMPIGYKMWVSIIPIKGLYASWENWVTIPQGAKLATSHQISLVNMKMENVKSGQSLSDFGFARNPFQELQ